MGGQQGKERHVLSNNGGGGTITRSSRAKYRAEKDLRSANVFTEHKG